MARAVVAVVGSLAILSAQAAPMRWAEHPVQGTALEPDHYEPVDGLDLVDLILEEEDADRIDPGGTDLDLRGDGSGEDHAAVLAEPYRWTAADVLAARRDATPRAQCVVDREIGGFGYDPWHRGSQGERGPVQLHPRGLLPEFLAWSGGQVPENPYWAIPFLEFKLRQGWQGARHWSPIRLGLC